jgi:hypothetical protein
VGNLQGVRRERPYLGADERQRAEIAGTRFAPTVVTDTFTARHIMPSFVHSVFFIVVSVIATLLVAGLTGIITVLLMNRKPAPRSSPLAYALPNSAAARVAWER